MGDNTKCSGAGCPIAEKCNRYTEKPSGYQSYFISPPFKIDKGKFTCDMFWGESSDLLLEQLKSMMKKK